MAMIFVTVGTHEQPFNRLIGYVDRLKGKGVIAEDVVMQVGFSTYEPKYSAWSKMFSYEEIIKKVEEAHIVITHGGPASFIMPLQHGKIPVVVPRQHQFGEHVNDHQVEFVKAVAGRMGTILPVYEINELESVIIQYDKLAASIASGMKSNNKAFNQMLEELIQEIF